MLAIVDFDSVNVSFVLKKEKKTLPLLYLLKLHKIVGYDLDYVIFLIMLYYIIGIFKTL